MRFTGAQWDTYQTFERRWKKLGYEKLSAAEQTFYALEALDSEINAGGLSQYFANQAGDLAPVVVDALSCGTPSGDRTAPGRRQGALKRLCALPDSPFPNHNSPLNQFPCDFNMLGSCAMCTHSLRRSDSLRNAPARARNPAYPVPGIGAA